VSEARFKVVIIGAGFGGLGMGIELVRAGIHDFVILDKGDDVGGCWRENRYPGAACDVPSHLYSFSFEPQSTWSRKFAPQAEILTYLAHCADRYGLRPHLRLNAEVRAAEFDAASGEWVVETTDEKRLRARFLVTACGQLSRPAYPRIPGLDRFGGVRFHSAHWNHAYDLTGKRVAVIGTGASAIQFVPAIAPAVGQLHLFQRSAAYVLPKPDREYCALERSVYRWLPALLALSRGKIYLTNESRALAFFYYPRLLDLYRWAFRRHLFRSVRDPALRRKLTPDYPLGCKRILISNDYYPALARPNVEVVTDAINEVDVRGVATADGRHRPVDAILFGTGFCATEFLAPMQVRGLDGRDLNVAWRDGAEAYLGMNVSGFPNLFILYGPNTNLGHNSIIYMLEGQIRYVLDCLRELQRSGIRHLDVRPEVQRRFNAGLQNQLSNSVWASGCTSWYQTASGRHTNNWPGFTFAYRRLTRVPNFEHYALAR
jgi:cation diffusion facilitator CzcD-associated flavoprotein CzcO